MRKAKRRYYRKIQLIAGWYGTHLYQYPFSWQHKEGKK